MMKTSKIKVNHAYLNTENVKLLKDGDVIEYYFDTMLNGRKNEKVIFRGIEKSIKSGVYGAEKRDVELIKVDYISPECFTGTKDWITRDIKANWFVYCIYTNGWNALHMVSVNGRKWEDVATENGFDNFLSSDEQFKKYGDLNIKTILDNVTMHHEEDCDIFSIPEEKFAKLQNNLFSYPEWHTYNGPIKVRVTTSNVLCSSNPKRIHLFPNSNFTGIGKSVQVKAVDFYIEEVNKPARHQLVMIGDFEKSKQELLNLFQS